MTKFFVLFSSMLVPLPLLAENEVLGELPENAAGKVEAEKGRICRVVCIKKPAGSPRIVHVFDGSKSHSIFLSSTRLSEKITIPFSSKGLSLSKNPFDKAKNVAVDAPRLALPSGLGDFYLIVEADESNKSLPFKLSLVDLKKNPTKTGETLWLNFSDHTILGSLGTTKVSIPGHSKVVSRPPLAKSGYYKAEFSYKIKGEGAPQKLMAKSWWYDATAKNVGFILDTGVRLPKVYSVVVK